MDKIFSLTAPRPGPQGIQISHSTGEEIPVEYLSFKLVNKQNRVRLSEKSFEYSHFPGKPRLFSVGNKRECFAAALRKGDGHYVTISLLSELHKSMESSPNESESSIQFTTRRSPARLPGTPHILTFACNDEYLIVAFLEGPIAVYDVATLLQGTHSEAKPSYYIPESPQTVARDIVPNPEENPEYVAILREAQNLEHQVDIVDIRGQKHIVGWRQVGADVIPVSICWSPKGKQFGIGLLSGDVLSYSLATPEKPKSYIARPSSISSENSALLSVTWISNTTWHLVFSPPNACFTNFDPSSSSSLVKTHIMLTIDPKTKATTITELMDPSPPFGAQIASGPVVVVLRNWAPAKYMLVCGDAPSSDIGVIGLLEGGSWINFSLEETSTPSLPLDDDMQDMPLLGLELGLTSCKPVSVSEQPDDGSPVLPPSPVLYAYLSDGTLIAWHILNSNGDRYPGMVGEMESSTPLLDQRPGAIETPLSVSSKTEPTSTWAPSSQKSPVFGQQAASSPSFIAPAKGFGAFSGATTTPSKFGPAEPSSTLISSSQTESGGNAASTLPPAFSGFAAKTPAPTFGATGFGIQPTKPTFGVSGFGAKPVFGQSGFASISNTSKPVSAPSSGGFATFAGQGFSGFGVQSSSNVLESKAAASVEATQDSTTAPQSAFGMGGVGQASPAPKHVPETSNFQSISPFGAQIQTSLSKPTTSSFFGQAGLGKTSTQKTSMDTFGGFTEFKDTLKSTTTTPPIEESPPRSPSSPTISPPDTPKVRIVPEASKPTSAYIKPPSGFGATEVSSKKPSPSFMKPAQGFGTFGAVTLKSQTATEDKQATPAHTTGFKSTTTTPVFGSTTALGNKHPAFGTGGFRGTTSGAAVNDLSKPITGGFSAFSSGNGFTSYTSAPGGKSFSELLSSSDSDLQKPNSAVADLPVKPPVSTFSVSKDKKETSSAESPRTEQETPSMAGSISQASSFSLLSLSETLSQKDQDQDQDQEHVKSRAKEQEGSSEKESVASEEFYVTESAFEGEVVEAEPGEVKSGSPSLSTNDPELAAKVPLPETPSPTATPKSLTPKPPCTELPVLEELPTQSKSLVEGEILESFTPPGSPQKPGLTSTLQAPIAVKPVSTASLNAPQLGSGFGLGRPSSRPIRSSPLANAPITNDEEEEEVFEYPYPSVTKTEQKPVAVPTQAIPSPPPSQSLPLAQTTPSVFSVPRRPNTPPLFGKPISVPVAHSQTQSPVRPALTSPQQLKSFASEGRFSPPTASAFDAQGSPSPQQGLELHPMQAEFLRAYEEVNIDLTKVDGYHKFMLKTYPGMHPSRGGLETIVQENREFMVNPMYSLVEAQAFRSIIDRLRTEILALMDQGKTAKQLLQTLQNLALISDVKQEELSRWVRAKKDPNFAKTLKPRTLGPEHAENQIKLRKALQIVHDRVQQCEDELEGLKKKLEQEKSGRLSLRPPTLDTIDRTCRNIQLALDEQRRALDQLSDRIDAMSPQTSIFLKSSQASSPSINSVAPPFASLAAAALNSERSALKLRDALLTARKRPLLTMATMKPEDLDPLDISFPNPPPEWQLPPMTQTGLGLSFPPPVTVSTPMAGSASRRRGSEKKPNAVTLKNSPVFAPDGSKSDFDWGPLPGVNPMTTISNNVLSPRK